MQDHGLLYAWRRNIIYYSLAVEPGLGPEQEQAPSVGCKVRYIIICGKIDTSGKYSLAAQRQRRTLKPTNTT